MEKIKFMPLTYEDGVRTYVKADAIVQMFEKNGKTYVDTINSDPPIIVKEDVAEILIKLERL